MRGTDAGLPDRNPKLQRMGGEMKVNAILAAKRAINENCSWPLTPFKVKAARSWLALIPKEKGYQHREYAKIVKQAERDLKTKPSCMVNPQFYYLKGVSQ